MTTTSKVLPSTRPNRGLRPAPATTLWVCVDLDGKLLQRFHGHTADVISVAWQGESDVLLSSSDDGTIKRWDIESGKIVEDIDLGGIETDTIAITNDGIIYAGNDEGEVIVIDENGKNFVQAHNAGIKRLVYDASQDMLVSLSYDRQVKVWSCSKARYRVCSHCRSANHRMATFCSIPGQRKPGIRFFRQLLRRVQHQVR